MTTPSTSAKPAAKASSEPAAKATISHTDHKHPSTPKARAACRKELAEAAAKKAPAKRSAPAKKAPAKKAEPTPEPVDPFGDEPFDDADAATA